MCDECHGKVSNYSNNIRAEIQFFFSSWVKIELVMHHLSPVCIRAQDSLSEIKWWFISFCGNVSGVAFSECTDSSEWWIDNANCFVAYFWTGSELINCSIFFPAKRSNTTAWSLCSARRRSNLGSWKQAASPDWTNFNTENELISELWFSSAGGGFNRYSGLLNRHRYFEWRLIRSVVHSLTKRKQWKENDFDMELRHNKIW